MININQSQNMIIVEYAANSGSILYALIAKNCIKLLVNFALLNVFKANVDHLKPNPVMIYLLFNMPNSKQLTTISIITQHLKAR